MAWVESHQELANHPKTKRLKRSLGISTPQAIGHLHLLWWWAQDYARDGHLGGFSTGEIADACEWEGSADELVSALGDAGFLDDDRHIHDWEQYGGKYFVRQEQSRIRQQRKRGTQTSQESDCHALVTRDIRVSHAAVTRLEEKREEEKREELSKPTVSHPPERGAYTQEFEDFWKPYPPTNGSKADAFKAWKQLKPEDRQAAVSALPAWLSCDQWRSGYVKHAGSWLRGRLWEVPPAQARGSPNGHSNGGGKPEDRRPSIKPYEGVERKSMSAEKLAEIRAWKEQRA